ncbi:MAG: peptidoglycan-binding protein [Candidatus Paceibacterota bacterium]
MIKKYIFGLLIALSVPALVAYAATPMLSVSGSGDGSNATVRITGGEINAPVVFFSSSSGQGNIQGTTIGTTDMNGNFTGTVNTNTLSINGSIPVYVQVGGYQSDSTMWPYSSVATTTMVTITPTTNPSVNASTLSVQQGTQGSIVLSGGATPYTISIPSGSGVTTTLVGNTLYVNGNATGTSMINVCSANGGGCTPVSVNVWAQGTSAPVTNSGSGNLAFTLPITVGQPVMVSLTGGIGNYYLQSPVSSPAFASLSGNTLTLNGATMGTGVVTICQTGASSCLPISFMVNPALSGTGGGYFYDTDLTVGMTSQDVMELQTRLRDEGFFTATPTGYFGPITMSAVMAYQSAHGISATGYVGPLTRAMLNQ